eukprot:TRINITY_DN8053_c0_g1_i1.p1 TRINITY_DN8053_c0_g1~~TRINITY_DN8053_c0_g1_i1.p1  ORF type:complete len:133 (-),score=26.36 TRINITY_DN8053_c0_g1_i1:101-499(-)
MSAEERIDVFAQFEAEANLRILVATDLAGRGLDFRNVGHVIQFDFATHMTPLLHRIGRTARVGRSGRVTSFVRPGQDLLPPLFDEIFENKLRFDPHFSHKRSLRKKQQRSEALKEEGNQSEGEYEDSNEENE